MYSSKPVRNKKGRIIYQEFNRRTTDKPVSRVKPDRQWFGNTRVVGQKELSKFREEMEAKQRDPYAVILRRRKLPMSLLQESKKRNRMNLLEAETFEYTFGKKRLRKRPKLLTATYESMAERNHDRLNNYDIVKDCSEHLLQEAPNGGVPATKPVDVIEHALMKGQSARIKGELFKVIDSSDVVIQVLDARDPAGTRSHHVEKYLKTACTHKHMIFVLNKIDLVPTWVTKRWIKYLSEFAPTLAFHASITNSFGKGSLINLLRQFQCLHPEKQHVSVGFIGYPNVGKSSIINTLVKKRSCKVAPIPGQTRVWQYISLFSKIYLVDCPGVVYPEPGCSKSELVLRGVVRTEILDGPEYYVEDVLKKIRPEYIRKTYGVQSWTNMWDFLEQLARKRGKLLKKGEPHIHCVAVQVLNDWERGRLPWFIAPPFEDDLEEEVVKNKALEEIKAEKDKLEEQEILYQELPKTGFAKEREMFGVKDISEDAYRAAFRGDFVAGGDGKNGPTEAELKSIVVANPLSLLDDDPLMIEAKKRVWWERKQLALKKEEQLKKKSS